MNANELIASCNTYRQLVRTLIKRFKSDGVIVPRGSVQILSVLYNESLRIGDVAKKVGVSQQAAGKVIHSMLQNNLAVIAPDEDKRAKNVVITELGKDVWREFVGIVANYKEPVEEPVEEDILANIVDDWEDVDGDT